MGANISSDEMHKGEIVVFQRLSLPGRLSAYGAHFALSRQGDLIRPNSIKPKRRENTQWFRILFPMGCSPVFLS